MSETQYVYCNHLISCSGDPKVSKKYWVGELWGLRCPWGASGPWPSSRDMTVCIKWRPFWIYIIWKCHNYWNICICAYKSKIHQKKADKYAKAPPKRINMCQTAAILDFGGHFELWAKFRVAQKLISKRKVKVSWIHWENLDRKKWPFFPGLDLSIAFKPV